ncbi:MAG TPA: Xaa-Pro peptidase family protein [Caldilineaceae bacterium]|nr:Xaa-Pro peptidase family protein [Caldilineaceae bacterium]
MSGTKLQTIQTYLTDHQLDGWLLYSFWQINPIALAVAGLKSGGSRRWFLWLPAEGEPVWLVNAIEVQTPGRAAPEMQGKVHLYASWPALGKKLSEIVQGKGGNPPRIAMEYSPNNAIPYASWVDAGTKELVEQSTGAEIVSSADLAQLTLAVLSAEDVVAHTEAANRCLAIKDAAYALIADRVRNGQTITEYDAQSFIIDQFKAQGMDPSFSPAVAINGNAAIPHYHPDEKTHSPISQGDVVLIDLWTRMGTDPHGCLADMTWTAYVGKETPAKVTEVFNVVAGARDRAVAFVQERLDAQQAVHGYEVDDAARGVIIGAGYGDYILHRTGHSLGWLTHFLGVNIDNMETQDQRQLLPGLMFTIEPGIYIPDFNFDGSSTAKGLGIRSEINCYMHADRVEVTTLPLQTEVKALLA